jgi:hypothetical protein
LARNVPYEAFFSRSTTSRVNAGRCGCFQFLTADFLPRSVGASSDTGYVIIENGLVAVAGYPVAEADP